MPLPPRTAVRELVLDALQLDPHEVPAELSSDTCAEWDSLGQIAIAAALFDRYGIGVGGEAVFRIRTLRDVEDLIGRQEREPDPAGTPRTHGEDVLPASYIPDDRRTALPDDLDMLPLLEPQHATRALAARFDKESAGAQRLRICIAASFTVQPIVSAVRVWGRAFGFEIDCDFAGYDQIVQTLLDPAGQFGANRNDVTVILTRPEDFEADSDEDSSSRMGQLLEALGIVRGGSGAEEGNSWSAHCRPWFRPTPGFRRASPASCAIVGTRPSIRCPAWTFSSSAARSKSWAWSMRAAARVKCRRARPTRRGFISRSASR